MSGSQTIFKPITNNSALLQTIFGGNTGTAASFKGEIVSIMPLKLYPGVIENLRPRRHRARHKCDVDIRMALQSDLIRAVFIQRRPGHFILLPTFNFKLKPLLPPAQWRLLKMSARVAAWQNVFLVTSFNT